MQRPLPVTSHIDTAFHCFYIYSQIVQTEVNVPVLRNFVEKMYPVAYDLAIRKRNTLVRLYSSYPIQEENFHGV